MAHMVKKIRREGEVAHRSTKPNVLAENEPRVTTASSPAGLVQLQRVVGNRGVVDLLQRKGGKGGKKEGTFIGVTSAHHLHVDIGNPHYQFGSDQSTRINIKGREFGGTYSSARLGDVRTALQGQTGSGVQACLDWVNEYI